MTSDTQKNRVTTSFIIVDEEHASQRIDNFLLSRLKGLPKTHLYKIIRKGEVRVNKKRVKPDYRLQAGDQVRIPPLRLATADVPAKPKIGVIELLEQRILYEDEGLIIINKPSGMAVHGGSGVSYGVIEALRQARPKAKFLELVHRLDRETSGCLLLAKKPSILRRLHEMLREGKVEKRYYALVKGHWPNNVRFVDVPLLKNQLRSGERMVNVEASGKPSLTEFKIVQRFANATLVEARPHTGRTHQIRVHATYRGHPLVGDEKYGDKTFNKEMRAFGCKRLFLHAVGLGLNFPETNKTINVEAQLDTELSQCLKTLPQ